MHENAANGKHFFANATKQTRVICETSKIFENFDYDFILSFTQSIT